MKSIETRRIMGTLALAAAAAMAAGCNRTDDGRTAGQKLDSAVAKADAQGDRMAADARSAGKDVSRQVGQASNEVVDKVKDAAITSEVNAKLIADSQLSALHIDVDTVNGRVTLNGTAPNAAAKEHATALATRIDGVVAVDNQLVVAAKGDGKG